MKRSLQSHTHLSEPWASSSPTRTNRTGGPERQRRSPNPTSHNACVPSAVPLPNPSFWRPPLPSHRPIGPRTPNRLPSRARPQPPRALLPAASRAPSPPPLPAPLVAGSPIRAMATVPGQPEPLSDELLASDLTLHGSTTPAMGTLSPKPEPLSDEMLLSDLNLQDKEAGLTNRLADSSDKSYMVHLSGLLSADADAGVGLPGKLDAHVPAVPAPVLTIQPAPVVPAPVLPLQPAPAVAAPVPPLQPAPVAEHLQMECLDPVSKREAKKASHKANAERRIKPAPPTSEQKEAEKRRLEERKQERYAIGLARVAEKQAAKSAKTAAEKEDKPRQLLRRRTSAGVSLPEQRVRLMVLLQPPLLRLQLQLHFPPRLSLQCPRRLQLRTAPTSPAACLMSPLRERSDLSPLRERSDLSPLRERSDLYHTIGHEM